MEIVGRWGMVASRSRKDVPLGTIAYCGPFLAPSLSMPPCCQKLSSFPQSYPLLPQRSVSPVANGNEAGQPWLKPLKLWVKINLSSSKLFCVMYFGHSD